MKAKRTLDLTEGSITGKLLSFTMPIFLSLVLQHLYAMADRIVVGNYAHNGTVALAAVGSTGAATTLVLNLFTGISVGTNVICSNLRGAKRGEELREAMHTAILLAAIFGVFLMGLGVVVTRPLLEFLDTPADVLDEACLYMVIYFLGVPGSLLYNFGAAILRSYGDSRRPMYILGATGIVNVLLNIVLVVGFGMDVAGVAIATITAQYISAVVVLIILFRPKDEYKMEVRELRIHKHQLKKMISVGVPCGINGMVFSVSNVTVQSALNSFNDPVLMAANAANQDISNFVYLITAAFYSACISFSGQCFGVRNYKRITQMALRSLLLSIGMIIVAAGLITLFPSQLLGLYNSDPAVIRAGTNKMIMISWGYILFAVSEIFLGCLRGMGRSSLPTMLNLVSICVPRLAWVALIFPLCRTYDFLYICFPVSWLISGSVQATFFFLCRRADDRKLAQGQVAKSPL